MWVYVALVGMVAFCVNYLLLLGTNRIIGAISNLHSIGLGALVCMIHSMLCTASGFAWFSGFHWNLLCLILCAILAYGLKKQTLKKGGVYILLSMALSWLTAGTGGGMWMAMLGAVSIFSLCVSLSNRKSESHDLMPVELQYKQERVSVWALRDTGNTLSDPLSGNPVLIVGPDVAARLLGLTQWQLENPVESLQALPGLRLIPYHTIGQSRGLLLGMRLHNIKIGPWQGSSLVAFAPYGLGEGKIYQALTGGYV